MGLPPREKNEASWALKRQLLATPALKPSPDQIRWFSSPFWSLPAERWRACFAMLAAHRISTPWPGRCVQWSYLQVSVTSVLLLLLLLLLLWRADTQSRVVRSTGVWQA